MATNSAESDILDGRQALITDALTHFMRCRSELAEFVRFYHTSAARAFRWDQPDFDETFHKEYLGQSIFFLENYIIRFLGMVDIFLEETVIDLAFALPDFISENEIDKARKRLIKREKSVTEIADLIVEAASPILRSSKLDISLEIKARCGVDAENCHIGWRDVLLLNHIRNIIVHNSSEVDAKFKAVCDDLGYQYCGEIGEMFLIPESEVMRIASNVDDWVWALDAEVSKFPQIFTRDRFGHLWIPRSTWGREKITKKLEDLNTLEADNCLS